MKPTIRVIKWPCTHGEGSSYWLVMHHRDGGYTPVREFGTGHAAGCEAVEVGRQRAVALGLEFVSEVGLNTAADGPSPRA